MNYQRYLFFLCIGILGIWSPITLGLSDNEVNRWGLDLDVLASDFVTAEKTFDEERKASFLSSIESIRDELKNLDEDHIVVRIMQAVALARNAHTAVFLSDYGPIRERLPIRFYCFDDGFYIVKSRAKYENLLGQRLVGIGEYSIETVHEAIGTLFYGNESWKRYNSLYPLITPSYLYGLDLISSPDSVTISLEDDTGTISKFILEPDPMPKEKIAEEPWWHMTPAYRSVDSDWKYVLDQGSGDMPLYLKNPNESFWYTIIPKQKTLYIQYNISDRPKDLRSSQLLRDIKKLVSKMRLTDLIFDFRMNTGGDYTLMRGLFERIIDIEPFKTRGSIYVITGPATFSAGIFHSVNIKTQGGIVAGELVGDDLDFWAEGSAVTLPNSKLLVFTNDGFHSYSRVQYPELEKFVYKDFDIDTLEPQIPAVLTFADFMKRRDPVLEAIFEN